MTDTYDIFISHTSSDTAVARRLAQTLSSEGFSVFLDVNSTPSAENWRDVISDALKSSRVIAVILSSGTVGAYASREISDASANARAGRSLLIPVFLDERSMRNPPQGL